MPDDAAGSIPAVGVTGQTSTHFPQAVQVSMNDPPAASR